MKIPLGDHPDVHYLEGNVALISRARMQSWFHFLQSQLHKALFSSLIKDEMKSFSLFWKDFS